VLYLKETFAVFLIVPFHYSLVHEGMHFGPQRTSLMSFADNPDIHNMDTGHCVTLS